MKQRENMMQFPPNLIACYIKVEDARMHDAALDPNSTCNFLVYTYFILV